MELLKRELLATKKQNGIIACNPFCSNYHNCEHLVNIKMGLEEMVVPKDTCLIFGRIGTFETRTTIVKFQTEEKE